MVAMPSQEIKRRSRSRSDAQAPAHVKRGVPLTDEQKAKAVDFLMAWVERRMV